MTADVTIRKPGRTLVATTIVLIPVQVLAFVLQNLGELPDDVHNPAVPWVLANMAVASMLLLLSAVLVPVCLVLSIRVRKFGASGRVASIVGGVVLLAELVYLVLLYIVHH